MDSRRPLTEEQERILAKQKENQIRMLKEAQEISTVLRIECAICGEAEEDIFEQHGGKQEREKLTQQFAEDLYNDGWRYTTSKTYGLVGDICPECVPIKDKPEEEEQEDGPPF